MIRKSKICGKKLTSIAIASSAPSLFSQSAQDLQRLLLPEVNNFDSELALPMLAQSLLPDVYVGLILAGLFAATMSTADSQILSCSAAITRDFKPGTKLSYLTTKFVNGLSLLPLLLHLQEMKASLI